MTNSIDIEHFKMKFGDKEIIKDLSFNVQQGEVFGLLGSNGSGKTTTIRALLGIYEPTGGTLHVNGKSYSYADAKTLGYLPEERGLYKKEKVIDVMTYFGKLKGLSTEEAKSWSLEYLERVGLQDNAQSKVEKMSGGMQQKVQLGVTIMGEPELLILDEPGKGFDPVNRKLLMDIIDEKNKEGAAVVLVTHQMDEVEKLCHRAVLLKDGEAAEYGTIDDIRDNFGRHRIQLKFSGTLHENPENYTIVRQDAHYAELEPKAQPQQVLENLMKQGLTINGFNVERASMDEIFVSIYGKKAAEDA